jgi:hypothetical protein
VTVHSPEIHNYRDVLIARQEVRRLGYKPSHIRAWMVGREGGGPVLKASISYPLTALKPDCTATRLAVRGVSLFPAL